MVPIIKFHFLIHSLYIISRVGLERLFSMIVWIVRQSFLKIGLCAQSRPSWSNGLWKLYLMFESRPILNHLVDCGLNGTKSNVDQLFEMKNQNLYDDFYHQLVNNSPMQSCLIRSPCHHFIYVCFYIIIYKCVCVFMYLPIHTRIDIYMHKID